MDQLIRRMRADVPTLLPGARGLELTVDLAAAGQRVLPAVEPIPGGRAVHPAAGQDLHDIPVLRVPRGRRGRAVVRRRVLAVLEAGVAARWRV